MGLFKSKAEREIEAKLQMEEQLQVFNEQIASLEGKRNEYAKMAVEAELNGDTMSYETALNALLDLSDTLSVLKQSKMNFDLINISNSTGIILAKALNALDVIANGKSTMPNMKKILKTQSKLKGYMQEMQKSQRGISMAMKSSNPANRPRTEEEKRSAQMLIEATRARIMPSVTGGIASEIEKEKSKIV